MRILIVEDDRKLARQVKKGMDEQGHLVTLAGSGTEGLDFAQQLSFDVIVLDVMLPGLDGFAVVRRLRAGHRTTPILILTARDSPEDIVRGLDDGADDYLTKPFSFHVLLARLRALARRKQVASRTHLQIADLVLDPAAHDVKRGGNPISLSRTEFEIVELLMRNAGRVLTRTKLIEGVWGYERDIQNNTIDVFIRQLRAKIELPGSARLIHTIRGVGYVLREDEPV